MNPVIMLPSQDPILVPDPPLQWRRVLVLSYGPDRTSVPDYWQNHSCDTADLYSKVSLWFLIHCPGFSRNFKSGPNTLGS